MGTSPRWLGLSFALSLGCAATLDGRRADGGSDAPTPLDANAPLDRPSPDVAAPDLPASDVFSPPPRPPVGSITVHVHTGPLAPHAPGAGFQVVVRSLTTDVGQTVTDAMGYASVSLTRGPGPYELTVAREGFTAVSVIEIPGAAEFNVYVRSANLTRPAGVTTQHISGRITGRRSPSTSIVVQGFAGTQVGSLDRYDMAFENWPGAPAMEPLVAEYDEANQMINAVGGRVGREARDLTADFALPSPPAQIERINLGVEFPFVGLMTPTTFREVPSQGVIRLEATAVGLTAVHYGLSVLSGPDTFGVAQWHIEALAAPLLPSLYWASWTHASPQAIRGSVAMRPPFRGLRPAVGVVEVLQVDPATPMPVVTAHFTRYDHAGFEVRSTNPGDNGRWTGFTYGATQLTRRPLPRLPAGVTLQSLFAASRPSQITAQVCVLRSLPDAPPPWQSDAPSLIFDNEITACTTEGPPLP